MHTDMNMTMSMHMRMGTNTNMVIALGTTIDLDLNPYENDGGYDCGHSCLSCYAESFNATLRRSTLHRQETINLALSHQRTSIWL